MNLYEISYDITDANKYSGELALRLLVQTLVDNLGSSRIRRFVASTLLFSSDSDYFQVLRVIQLWSVAANTYFVLSKIMPDSTGARFYYAMQPSPMLQLAIDEMVAEALNAKRARIKQ